MMRRTICFAAIAIIFAGCSGRESPPLVPGDYTTWKRTTTIELNYPIPGHEDNYRIIYINSIGEGIQISEKNNRIMQEYPTGTIIAKEIYPNQVLAGGDKPVQLTVMVKDPENENSRGGWIWLVKNMVNEKETIITGEFCVTCHANANEQHPYGEGNQREEFRDFVFFPMKPK